MKRAAERWMGALVALSAFLFYLARPSGFYNFDGVACAIAVELGDFAHLTHGNHLAYGVLGWAFHRLLLLLGFGGTALLSLQLLDTLLGAAGVGLFYGWLKEQKIPGPAALAASACLATSYAYWFWSLEAQVYMLGAVFLLLAARELFSERPRPLLLGLLHAGAVLGHVGHVMFVPAALYLLRRGPGHKKAIRDYLAALAGAVLAAYAFAGAAMVAPRSGRELTIWLLGSAALTTSKSFLWHGGLSLSGIWAWLTMCLRIFCDPLEGFWASVAAGLLAFAALGLAGLGARDLRPKARACLLWLAGYALLYVLWEPYTIVYRITDLLPLWFLAAEALKGRGRVAALASWAVLAGALNAATAVGPRADIARNEAYQDAIAIAKLAPENAWVAVSSAGQVYVPYFAHLRPLNLRYFPDAEALKARVDALRAAGDPVIVAPEVLADSSAGVLLSGLEFREIGRRGGSAIYEIR